MKISVVQVENEGTNKFEINYNNSLKYKATLPFVSIKDPFNLEKLRQIKIYDTNNNEIYNTDYNLIENYLEEFIPMKFMVTGNQKFNQLMFISNNQTIKIYYEENGIWDNRYVIEINNKKYYSYSIEDGYIRHFPIYDGENQIGEALKSNVLVDFKDEYWCYLKNEYDFLSDAIVALLLYLDRSQYSSSYLANKSYDLSKKYSYNKTNKYYDKEWVNNNFGNEFYEKVDEDIKIVKDKLNHPIKTSNELINTMPKEKKTLLMIVLILPWALLLLFGLFFLVIYLLVK